jgi:formylglycine-generating enzyme required for sulfatase activity
MRKKVFVASIVLFIASLVLAEQRGSPPVNNSQGGDKVREQSAQGDFVQIAAGEFMMGSENGNVDERPVHKVRISDGLEMSKYEVTQKLWQEMMGSNPSAFKGANLPVQKVTWHDVQAFIKKMNQNSDSYVYRLPTEAEWEYSCRAGSTGDFPQDIDSVAWFYGNSGGRPHPVGTKRPNAWALYDMHGNVWEWCQDWYSEAYYRKSPVLDPMGPESGSLRVVRRGSFLNSAGECRHALRTGITPDYISGDLGFRLVRRKR